MKPVSGIPTTASTLQPSYLRSLKWNQRVAVVFSAHWLFILTSAAVLFIGLGLLAPLLMLWGLEPLAKALYELYSPFCHQFAHRSWFLFGESPVYTSEHLLQLTSINTTTPVGRLASRNFIGNTTLGWKSAYCQRDIAISIGVLLASLLYYFLRAHQVRIRSTPWILYLLIGIVPIALDSLTQLLPQLPLPFPLILWHESTPTLRTSTGLLFGSMNVWLAYPHLDTWMAETRTRYLKT